MPFRLVDCRKKASFRVLPLCRICALSLSVLCFPTTGTKMVCHLPLFLLLPLIFLGLYVSDLWGSRLLVVFAAAFCVISHEQGGYPQGAGEFLRLPHSICSANNFVFSLCDRSGILLPVSSICFASLHVCCSHIMSFFCLGTVMLCFDCFLMPLSSPSW
jgi:hypothetical protein